VNFKNPIENEIGNKMVLQEEGQDQDKTRQKRQEFVDQGQDSQGITMP
jgi:hypothetical protein